MYQTPDNLTEINVRKIKIISTETLYLRHILALKPSWVKQEVNPIGNGSLKTCITQSNRSLMQLINLSHSTVKQAMVHNNLTKDELKALESLKKRDDIIITRADNGGAVVIISLEDYIKEAKSPLDNTEFYANFAKEKILPMHVARALIIDEPKTSHYYGLQKTHQINYSVLTVQVAQLSVPSIRHPLQDLLIIIYNH